MDREEICSTTSRGVVGVPHVYATKIFKTNFFLTQVFLRWNMTWLRLDDSTALVENVPREIFTHKKAYWIIRMKLNESECLLIWNEMWGKNSSAMSTMWNSLDIIYGTLCKSHCKLNNKHQRHAFTLCQLIMSSLLSDNNNLHSHNPLDQIFSRTIIQWGCT